MSTIKLRFLLNKRMVAYPWIRQYNHPLGDMRKHEYLLVRCNSVLQLQNALFYFLHGGKTFKLPKSLVILFWLKRSRNIILFGRNCLRLTNGNFYNCRKRIFAQKIMVFFFPMTQLRHINIAFSFGQNWYLRVPLI